MYKIKEHRKHLIQVELDNEDQIDLITRLFEKLMVWSDEPMFPLQDGMKFGFMAYTTKINLKHMFNMVGISDKDPYTKDCELKPVNNAAKNFIIRLYHDRKFIKKHMHRKNYLPIVAREKYDAAVVDNVLRRLTGVGLDHKWVKKPKRKKPIKRNPIHVITDKWIERLDTGWFREVDSDIQDYYNFQRIASEQYGFEFKLKKLITRYTRQVIEESVVNGDYLNEVCDSPDPGYPSKASLLWIDRLNNDWFLCKDKCVRDLWNNIKQSDPVIYNQASDFFTKYTHWVIKGIVEAKYNQLHGK